jgi:hypothetical protein
MNLLELLDHIDASAPRGCQTCRHMATHLRCDGCLNDVPRGEPFPYRNWEPGNWLRELHAAEIEGTCNIVIGGQGEADFCAIACPESVAKHLHHVARQCGYLCGALVRRDKDEKLTIVTNEGEYSIHWHCGKLVKIASKDNDCWRADDPGLREW